MKLVKTFIKKLSALGPSKSLQEKFRDFIELAYCAYVKRMTAPEDRESIEARYMQILGAYRDKDAVRRYSELVVMVSDGVQSCDFLGAVARELGAFEISDPRPIGRGDFLIQYWLCLRRGMRETE